VLSHDGPNQAIQALLSCSLVHKERVPTRTAQVLNAMLEVDLDIWELAYEVLAKDRGDWVPVPA
jgi:hypothetical protein